MTALVDLKKRTERDAQRLAKNRLAYSGLSLRLGRGLALRGTGAGAAGFSVEPDLPIRVAANGEMDVLQRLLAYLRKLDVDLLTRNRAVVNRNNGNGRARSRTGFCRGRGRRSCAVGIRAR